MAACAEGAGIATQKIIPIEAIAANLQELGKAARLKIFSVR
jgi:hypothetical protein